MFNNDILDFRVENPKSKKPKFWIRVPGRCQQVPEFKLADIETVSTK